jgi:hypothetical protein
MNIKDNRCSSRSEDWSRFCLALIGMNTDERRHDNPLINYVLKIGHTGKNIVVEEWRRWTGYCKDQNEQTNE